MRRSIPGFCVILAMAQSPSYFQQDRRSLRAFVHRNSPTPEKYLIEKMGGGVAVLD